jgi:hypothetical protein
LDFVGLRIKIFQLKKLVVSILIMIELLAFNLLAQRPKLGLNLTYNLYSNLDDIDGVKSSWNQLYTYNYTYYYYDIQNHYWPYDQLNMDISLEFGGKAISFEPFYSFTIIKGWYGVTYDDGKYIADEPVLYLPQSANNPIFIDGDEYLYAQGSGQMGQTRYGANFLIGKEIKIGTGIWWQKQKIELSKSMAYNKYWFNSDYSRQGRDAYVTSNDDIYVYSPIVQTIYKTRILVPLIIRYSNGPFSSHTTFIFQKPFQFLTGFGIYF